MGTIDLRYGHQSGGYSVPVSTTERHSGTPGGEPPLPERRRVWQPSWSSLSNPLAKERRKFPHAYSPAHYTGDDWKGQPQDSPLPAPCLPECTYCGPLFRHPPERCPLVRAIDYYPNGKLRRVELLR